MSHISQEALIEYQPIPVSKDSTKEILSQMENYICILYPKSGKKGTGFFCKIPLIDQCLPVLITNNHVLGENDIENNKIIELSINNKPKKIKIDDSRIKYTNPEENKDITIIEIKPNKDGINNYLELDDELNYIMKSIYILHYPRGKLNVSYGLIKKLIYNQNIGHYCNTEKGSSGAPILSLETLKLIGIHCGYNEKYEMNWGINIKYAINLFKEYINKTAQIKCLFYYINVNKSINKSTLYKIKSKPRYQLNSNNETFKLNDNENTHYNDNKYNEYHELFFQKNLNKRLDDKNHRIIIEPNSSVITDINYSKLSNNRMGRNSFIKYIDNYKYKIENNTISDIDIKNDTGNKIFTKMNKIRKFLNNNIHSKNEDLKSHTQNTSPINLIKNKKQEIFEGQKIESKYYKKNQKIKETANFYLDKNKNKINKINMFQNIYNNKIIDINNNKKIKGILLNYGECEKQENIPNFYEQFYDNKKIYLKSDRKRSNSFIMNFHKFDMNSYIGKSNPNIYYKRRLEKKNYDTSTSENKAYKKEQTDTCSINCYQNIYNKKNLKRCKPNFYINTINDSFTNVSINESTDYLFAIDSLKVKVANSHHCFKKKFYDFLIKKPKPKICYIYKLTRNRNIKNENIDFINNFLPYLNKEESGKILTFGNDNNKDSFESFNEDQITLDFIRKKNSKEESLNSGKKEKREYK